MDKKKNTKERRGKNQEQKRDHMKLRKSRNNVKYELRRER